VTAPSPGVDRRTALLVLGLITALGGFFRFYGLAWGAPYFHFHQDEHFVFEAADMLRRDPRVAAMSPKFFMYAPLVPYLINICRDAYEAIGHPLNLSVFRDEVTYMLIGRIIVAAIGTATIPLVYALGVQLGGRVAGLLAAFFLACSVLHLQSSHFGTTDIPMTFFCVLALWYSLRIVDRPGIWPLVGAGLAFGAAILCKYAGGFVLGVIGLAYVLSPSRPRTLMPLTSWIHWAARGLIPIAVGCLLFLALDPLVWKYFGKFRSDIKEWVTDPLTGVTKPIWVAQFANVSHPGGYWFTNLLWWSVGPSLEILGVVGIVWLFFRRQSSAVIVAMFPIAYFIATGDVSTPFVRYAVPLTPALAISAAVLGVDLLARPATKRLASLAIWLTVISTGGYALAYMNVYRQPDSRLQASKWLVENVPAEAQILIEPSQNTPPVGSYFTNVTFNRDYVLWGPPRTPPDRHDRYELHTLDGYRALYRRGPTDDDRRNYIAGRLALADWIVMDDSYLQWYGHLPAPEYAVMKNYYDDLFAGRLGFVLVKTFKSYPSIAGVTINDDGAEMTFRHFDHPRVFIFSRQKRVAG
jgi:4-amino-4-deoxy-L-arabinose transferase-like glycosyltransferase